MPAIRRSAGWTLVLGLLAFASAGAQQERLLTLQDLSPDLARLIGGTPLDFVASSRISYGVTGRSNYDEFFRNSAVSYGGYVVGQRLTDDATTNLKRYARSKAAVAELQDQIRELTQGADTSEWTTEQSLAVLRAARERDQLSAEESSYMLATAAHLAATIPVLEAAISSSTQLSSTGPSLVRSAPGDFGMMKSPAIVRNLRRSTERVSAIPTEGPRLVESMLVLSRGLALINGQ